MINESKQPYPQISIVLISGFGTDDLVTGNIRQLLDDFCKKPISLQTLLAKIHGTEQKRKNRQI